MARDMNDTGEAFRARITVRGANGLRDVFQGPYANGGAAKSRITWAKRTWRDRFVSGVVERASTNWEPVA